MMLRTKLTRGRLINSRSPRSKRQFARARSSVMLCKHCSASRTLRSKNREDFLHALRLRRHEVPLAHIETVLLEHARHAPRNARNVRGQLPQRHRLRMWLPREFLLRNPLEHSLGCSNFLAKLIQHRIGNCSHSSSSPKAVSKFQRFQSFNDNSRFNFETCNLETLKPHYFYFSEQHPSFDCAINMRASSAFGSPYLSWCRTHA